MRNFDLPGRSPVHATGGMAATSQPLATWTALEVLRGGGNAVDAAVAACAVQCVVEPESTGIGGDCFALIAPADGSRVIAFNGSGRAPAAATVAALRGQGLNEIPRRSPHAVTIPGAVDAWARLVADHGRKPLGDLLRPAIRLARDGYPVHGRAAFDWAVSESFLAGAPDAARVFLPGGRAPRAGEIHRQPGLAEALTRIAEWGRDGFYRGPVADDILSCLRGLGGLHTAADFERAAGAYVEPISAAWQGIEVVQCPPNGQGFVVLEMLGILRHLEPLPDDPLSPDRFHLFLEAARLAYQDRDAWLADPDHEPVPLDRILAEERLARLAARVDRRRAGPPMGAAPVALSSDTVYLCVVDGEGTAVSLINSLFFHFGGGLCTPRYGILLQNRGCGFTLDPAHPNRIAPNKRPLHTLIPGMVLRGGRVEMPYGVMGGFFQAAGHVNFLANHYRYGMDVQAAIDAPRAFLNAAGAVEAESGVPAAVTAELAARGHVPTRPDQPLGGGQAIRIDRDGGVLTGGSDPRKDGCALGFPAP